MTTIECNADIHQPTGLAAKVRALLAAWRAAQMRRRLRRAEVTFLSGLDARLLRDIGLEPADIEDAVNRRTMSALFYPIRRRPNHE